MFANDIDNNFIPTNVSNRIQYISLWYIWNWKAEVKTVYSIQTKLETINQEHAAKIKLNKHKINSYSLKVNCEVVCEGLESSSPQDSETTLRYI